MTVDQSVPTKPAPTLATTPRIVRASRSPSDAASGVARLSDKTGESARTALGTSSTPFENHKPRTRINAKVSTDYDQRAHESTDDSGRSRRRNHTSTEDHQAFKVTTSFNTIDGYIMSCQSSR